MPNMLSGVQAVIWIHAGGWARWFWGGLTAIGAVWVGAGPIAAWVSAGLDLGAAVSPWWDGWHWPVIAALGCGVVWVLTFSGYVEPTIHGGFTLSAAGVDVAALQRRLAVGLAGEARVRALFLEELPEGMWVLNNLRLPGLGGDIDLLVVGANGVFLPEVKTWSGAISCAPDGRTWSRVRAGRWELLPNPAAQTQGEIRALRRYLESADPQLCRRTQLWIEGLIVFERQSARLWHGGR
jgi:Nuclease-related domain